MVRTERLELSHLAAPEPKSGVSTNSTTSAWKAGDTNDFQRLEQLSSLSPWQNIAPAWARLRHPIYSARPHSQRPWTEIASAQHLCNTCCKATN